MISSSHSYTYSEMVHMSSFRLFYLLHILGSSSGSLPHMLARPGPLPLTATSPLARERGLTAEQIEMYRELVEERGVVAASQAQVIGWITGSIRRSEPKSEPELELTSPSSAEAFRSPPLTTTGDMNSALSIEEIIQLYVDSPEAQRYFLYLRDC